MRTILRIMATAAVAVAPFLPRSDASAMQASGISNPCGAVSPAAMSLALGTDLTHVSTVATSRQACNWHHNDPSCALRSIGLTSNRRRTDLADGAEILDGLGDDAYATPEPWSLELGAAILVLHLDVRYGTTWQHWTFSGRADQYSARDLLIALARATTPSR